MGRLTAFGALLCVVGSTPVFAECTTADRAALLAFDVAYTKASVAGDRAALASIISDNFGNMSVIGGGSKTGMIENAVNNAARNAANPQPQQANDRFTFVCTPTLATIMHRNINPPVAPATYPTYSRSMHVLEKKGSSWQLVTTMSNDLTDQQKLFYMEQDWNDATQNHDIAWFEKNYAPFYRGVTAAKGASERKDDAIADIKKGAETFDSMQLSELAFRIEGDAAVVSGVNTVKGKDSQGKAFDEKHRFTDTFIRRDGQWQVWATQGTIIK
jgi:ketosteroid isomerase-like protein